MILLTYLGDALWVLALAIMFSTSGRAAQMNPAAKLRVFRAELPRALVLWALPGGAFLLSLWLALQARTEPGAEMALIIFGVRATLAALLALLHLRLLREAARG